MSVATVGSDASQSLAQYFQRLAADREAQTSATQSASSAQPSAQADSATDPTADPSAQTAPHAHHHHGGGAVRGKIESAVTTALQNFKGDGDVNKVVQDAIKSVVASGGSSAAATSATPATATANSTDPTSSQSSDAFQQLLSSNGIDASQFRDDLTAAFKSANGTETAGSGALTALPPGSFVDTEG